eukprot:scaffold69647_cov23-Tisochrysis_lutea.AAC.3
MQSPLPAAPALPWCVCATCAGPSACAPWSNGHRLPPAAPQLHAGGCPASGAAAAKLTGSVPGKRTWAGHTHVREVVQFSMKVAKNGASGAMLTGP